MYSRKAVIAGLQIVASNDPFAGMPAVVSIRGNRDFDSEEIIACKLGYRGE
ncbi:MAG: hypothetical protein KAV83_08975 [Desulfobacterales bacterium]|nr:hypothetical protein [Desulfobacterales bacterium]